MLLTRRLDQALLLGLAILYGTGKCNVYISNKTNSYCSDVVCFPLNISKMEYLTYSMNPYNVCAAGNRTAQTVRSNTETFFNKECPTRNAGPTYNKSDIETACVSRGKITSVRVTYNCSSAAAATLTSSSATTSWMNEGSRSSNSTTSGNATMKLGDTVAAAICTTLGVFVIVFIAVYLWRRKFGNECMPQMRSRRSFNQYQDAHSGRAAAADVPGAEFWESVYENSQTHSNKRPAIGANVAESLRDETSPSKDFGSQYTEVNLQDMPFYLDVLPSDSNHGCISDDSPGARPTRSKVQDEKDNEHHENYYSLPLSDTTYFVLEQLPLETSNVGGYISTPTSEITIGAEAEH